MSGYNILLDVFAFIPHAFINLIYTNTINATRHRIDIGGSNNRRAVRCAKIESNK